MKKKLMKIAEIKIGKSDKLYDYYCNDLKVEEGDFVYVENINYPVFVYGIKSVSESLANKSILKVVRINKNVKVYTKYEDVTKIECDCVVNSLGTNLSLFGSICKAIVTNAHSKEIDDMIKNNPTANIFDTFVTDAGDLKCKKVIHIVMPYKQEDRYNNSLKEAFCKVINKAIELGLKSIAIPKIGTGANGYSINDIYDALRDVTLKYQYTEGLDLEIINLLFDTSISNVTKERKAAIKQRVIKRIDSEAYFDKFEDGESANLIINEMRSSDDYDYSYKKSYARCLDKINDYTFKTETSYIIDLINNKYNKKDEFTFIGDLGTNPFFFAWEYGKKEKKLHNIGGKYTNDVLKKFRQNNNPKILRKDDCLRLSLLTEMNFTTIIEFMCYAGYSFAPLTKNDFDLEIFKYIYKYNGFVEGQQHFETYLAKNSINSQYIIDVLINGYPT